MVRRDDQDELLRRQGLRAQTGFRRQGGGQAQVQRAVTQAAEEELVATLHQLEPDRRSGGPEAPQ